MRTKRAIAGLVVLVSACGTKAAPDGARDAASVEDAAPAMVGSAMDGGAASASVATPVDAAPTLRVEEWGTYTSVQGSDGHTLGGVHHEDERLPYWVHRREWGPDSYYVEDLREEPLQQLETPVLYFWAPVAKAIEVTVDFPRGVVGQWYPDAASFTPPLRALTTIAGGAMSWQLTLDPSVDPASFLPVSADEIWAPSRRVKSTPVRWTGPEGVDEREQFIFYRGLGTFEPPVHVVTGEDGALRIGNTGQETAAATFVLHVDGPRGTIVPLGPLAAGTTTPAAVPAGRDDLETYVAVAHAMLKQALIASGLHVDVAAAMVDTWSRSWFRNPGLRLLYLAPRAWTDAWLPTTINPTPSAFVRTLVGRIEILRPDDEQGLLAVLRDHRRNQTGLDLTSLGRFAEPRLRRALEQMTTAEEVAYVREYVDLAHRMR